MLYEFIGKQIQYHRKKKGFTQEQLSDIAEISLSFLGHIERGTRKLSVDTLYKIANALNCSADELMGTQYPKQYHDAARELLIQFNALAEKLQIENADDPHLQSKS